MDAAVRRAAPRRAADDAARRELTAETGLDAEIGTARGAGATEDVGCRGRAAAGDAVRARCGARPLRDRLSLDVRARRDALPPVVARTRERCGVGWMPRRARVGRASHDRHEIGTQPRGVLASVRSGERIPQGGIRRASAATAVRCAACAAAPTTRPAWASAEARLERRPDLELRARAPDHLVGELASCRRGRRGRRCGCRRRPPRARPRGSRAPPAAPPRRRARAAPRRRGSSPSGSRRSCPKSAGAVPCAASAISARGHVVVVERDEQRLRAGDRAEERQHEVGEDVAVAVERRDDERRAGRARAAARTSRRSAAARTARPGWRSAAASISSLSMPS